jgi:translation initiation factor IF-2
VREWQGDKSKDASSPCHPHPLSCRLLWRRNSAYAGQAARRCRRGFIDPGGVDRASIRVLSTEMKFARPLSAPKRPRSDSTRPRSDSNRPRSDSNRPRSDSNRPRSDSNRPRSDSNRPRSDSNRPCSVSNRPRSDATRPRSDSNRRRSVTGRRRAGRRWKTEALGHGENPCPRKTRDAIVSKTARIHPCAWGHVIV